MTGLPGQGAGIDTVPSPCVDICRMDGACGLCVGCWRTLDEIAAWSTLDGEARRAVWARLDGRRAVHAGVQAPTGESPAPPGPPA